ncbi:MAG TPA: serine/threonine-protein kinase, partial [Pyrinomonadaceae bacterium]|nr:serine/threonine-protein kinase [Pyrinomonadaceae bacterium]
FQANQQIGGYTLIKQIGRGGFGEVWLAERRTEILTTQVAIKLPHREQVNLEAIRQEAELWAKASGHANILPIIEANIYDGQIVIVSEYAPDGSLEEKIQQEIPIKETLETVIGILNGLEFLHNRQIIHRDIKPANILLQGETPRLADFGISRIIKTTALSTSIVGTPKYMAPEAFDGKRTAQTDIWSVGVILYQMLTQKLPYPQDNPTELMWAIVSKEFEPLPESIPPDLRKIVHRALAKVSENRFQSAREMREEVQRALLNISHPTFAPTEVLEKKPLDNLTIEDKSIFRDKPLVELPKIIPTPAHLVDKTVNQNQPLSNISTEYNLILRTVPSVEPQFQEFPPPTVPQITELTNQQKNGFHWGLYLLPLLLDLVVRVTTFNLSFKLTTSFFGTAYDLGGLERYNFKKIIYVELPIEVFIYGIIGLLFGLIFPQGKWKWGILLNVGFFVIAFFAAPPNQWTASIILVSVTTLTACLTSYIAARLSPRKPVTSLAKLPEAWTRARVVRWIFYILAPIIGGLTSGILNKLAWVLMLILPQNIQGDEAASLVQMPLSLIVFGVIGTVFGYVFPQGKWKWGVLLNLLILVYAISKANIFLSLGDSQRALIIIFLFLISLISSCLTSYLGSWLAMRNDEKKL